MNFSLKLLLFLLLICSNGCSKNDNIDKKEDLFSAPSQVIVKPYILKHDEWELTVLADYEIKASVLGVERYRFDRGALLSPIDLALGWSVMALPENYERVNIRQRGRFYYWRVDKIFIPLDEIRYNSANVHIIPANDDIKNQLFNLNDDDYVHMKGYLVEIKEEHFTWKSSLTRKDTGAGACELFYVSFLSL